MMFSVRKIRLNLMVNHKLLVMIGEIWDRVSCLTVNKRKSNISLKLLVLIHIKMEKLYKGLKKILRNQFKKKFY